MDKTALIQQLEAAYSKSLYHSFLASLKGVTEVMARWEPEHYKGFPHMTGSILNLAYHTGGDKFVLMSVAFGDGSVTWDKVQARFEEYGGNLEAAKKLAAEGHQLVLETLEKQNNIDAIVPYYRNTSKTAEEIFRIVIEHDLYHAGQINFVKNLYAGLKQNE